MSLRSRVGDVVGRTRRARLITVATVVAIGGALIAFAALDTDDEPGSDLTPYQGEADRICVEGKQKLGEAGERIFTGGGAYKFAQYGEAASRITAETRTRLAALDPPEEFRSRATELDDALRGLDAPLRELEAAGRSNDPAELKAAVDKILAASQRSDEAVDALGLDACATLEVGLVRLRPR